MILSNDASPLTLPATVFAVAASIFVTTKYKPIARPVQTLLSRSYYLLLIFMKSLQPSSNVDDSTMVTSLYKYPVKSLRTIPCDEAVLDTKGFVGDRRYMIVSPAPLPLYGSFLPDDATHRFITQRQCPILARIVVSVIKEVEGPDKLQFSSDVLPNDTCTISMEPELNAPIYKSTLWGDIVTVQDMGDKIAAYVQRIVEKDESIPDELKKELRLTIQYVKDDRTANDKFVPPSTRSLLGKNPSVHLGDGFPLLIASEASLTELNRRLKEKGKELLPMARFRPNIVIKGTTPFIEDKMKVIQIGETILHIVSSCPRCKQSCTDQTTGIVTDEPVMTLRDFRTAPNDPDNVYFAVNAIPAPSSVGKTIRVGDTVKILQWGNEVYGDP